MSIIAMTGGLDAARKLAKEEGCVPSFRLPHLLHLSIQSGASASDL